jgi:hypothetical protein
MTRPFLWFAKRLAFISLAVAGAALALFAYSRIGRADITPGINFGKYTYSSSDCHEADESAEDPINVVFYDDAPKYSLDYYFNLYHGWGDNGGETQYFKTNGLCHVMDGQPSSQGAGVTRYHARYSRGRTSSGVVDYDQLWGDYSVAAAHYEEWWIGGDCGWGNHVVPQNGFNEGRDNVTNNWVNEPSPGHFFAGLMDWGNTLLRQQCNHTWAGSDGKVAFIKVYLDSDGDGCGDSDEAAGAPAPKPGSTGAYDPHNYWDFYDVPVPANADPTPNGPKNRAITMGDVLAILFYVGTRDGEPPNARGVDYDSVKDGDWNGDTVVTEVGDQVGLRYDHSPSLPPDPPWGTEPPDGAVSMADVLAALSQMYLSCSAPSGGGPDGGDASSGEGGVLDSAPNAMAVDAIAGGGIDQWRVVTSSDPFDISVVVAAAGEPYAGYDLALSYDDQILEFVPTADLDGDTGLESWTYTGLGGMSLNATVSALDEDGDTAPDRAAGGSARSSGSTSATGAVVTERFRCIASGTSPVHLVSPATTTLGIGGATINTSLADASVWCWGIQ